MVGFRMEISRRSFLGGVLSVAAATALPNMALAEVPVIYGDGRHDDWAGLQAMLDGRPFRAADGAAMVLRGEPAGAFIAGGHFRVSRTLMMTNRVTIIQSSFIQTADFVGDSALVVQGAQCPDVLFGVYVEREGRSGASYGNPLLSAA